MTEMHMPTPVRERTPAPDAPGNGAADVAPSRTAPRSSRLHAGPAGDASWSELVHELAAALALADGADLLEGDVRRSVLAVAARQLRDTAQRISVRMEAGD